MSFRAQPGASDGTREEQSVRLDGTMNFTRLHQTTIKTTFLEKKKINTDVLMRNYQQQRQNRCSTFIERHSLKMIFVI